MNEQVEQRIRIKFCVRLENSSTETIQMIQKANWSMGNWWLAASSRQCVCSCIMSCAEFFGETSNHPGDSAPLQPRFGALWLLVFLKTTITFERERDFRPLMRFRKIWRGSWWQLVKLCEVPRYLLWRGLRGHCPMYKFLVSSSTIVSIFHITWLHTFWTVLVCCIHYDLLCNIWCM